MTILFNTGLRGKLLTYSFTHTDKEYYVRELASMIGEDPGNISRELRKLEKEGLYKSFSRGGLKFYSLNNKYPLFDEFKKIIFKTEGVEGTLRSLISQYKDITLAFIYGSYAKHAEKENSDIDLVVVGNLALDKFTRQIRLLESKLNREINFNHYSSEDFDKEKEKKGSFLNITVSDRIILLKGSL